MASLIRWFLMCKPLCEGLLGLSCWPTLGGSHLQHQPRLQSCSLCPRSHPKACAQLLAVHPGSSSLSCCHQCFFHRIGRTTWLLPHLVVTYAEALSSLCCDFSLDHSQPSLPDVPWQFHGGGFFQGLFSFPGRDEEVARRFQNPLIVTSLKQDHLPAGDSGVASLRAPLSDSEALGCLRGGEGGASLRACCGSGLIPAHSPRRKLFKVRLADIFFFSFLIDCDLYVGCIYITHHSTTPSASISVTPLALCSDRTILVCFLKIILWLVFYLFVWGLVALSCISFCCTKKVDASMYSFIPSSWISLSPRPANPIHLVMSTGWLRCSYGQVDF